LRSRRRRKGKNAVRFCVAAFRRQGASSYKVHSTLWTDTCHLDQLSVFYRKESHKVVLDQIPNTDFLFSRGSHGDQNIP
jgi:hypothetical protein